MKTKHSKCICYTRLHYIKEYEKQKYKQYYKIEYKNYIGLPASLSKKFF